MKFGKWSWKLFYIGFVCSMSTPPAHSPLEDNRGLNRTLYFTPAPIAKSQLRANRSPHAQFATNTSTVNDPNQMSQTPCVPNAVQSLSQVTRPNVFERFQLTTQMCKLTANNLAMTMLALLSPNVRPIETLSENRVVLVVSRGWVKDSFNTRQNHDESCKCGFF